MRYLVIVVALLALGSPSLAAEKEESQNCIRNFVHRARLRIADLPRPEREPENPKAFEGFKSKRRILLRAMKKTLLQKKDIGKKLLEKMQRYVEKLHALGSLARMYPLGSTEDADYSLGLSLAKSSLELASQIVRASSQKSCQQE